MKHRDFGYEYLDQSRSYPASKPLMSPTEPFPIFSWYLVSAVIVLGMIFI